MFSSIKRVTLFACALLAAICLLDRQSSCGSVPSTQAPASPHQGSEYVMQDDGSMFLSGGVYGDCAEDESPAQGKLPECEPTCDNPKPVCIKIFYILDIVPCFCKAPMVRNKLTNKCVMLEDCPKSN